MANIDRREELDIDGCPDHHQLQRLHVESRERLNGLPTRCRYTARGLPPTFHHQCEALPSRCWRSYAEEGLRHNVSEDVLKQEGSRAQVARRVWNACITGGRTKCISCRHSLAAATMLVSWTRPLAISGASTTRWRDSVSLAWNQFVRTSRHLRGVRHHLCQVNTDRFVPRVCSLTRVAPTGRHEGGCRLMGAMVSRTSLEAPRDQQHLNHAEP